MNLQTRITDLLSRYQKILEAAIILLFCSLISFRFSNRTGMKFFLRDYPTLTLLTGILLGLLSLTWVRLEKRRTRILVDDLKRSIEGKLSETEARMAELSPRQKEVFDLIRLGKSNKEIMQGLNIELSTLKTHINQIYKILGARNRKEAKQFD
jgi:DNA-binding CsgD family transcriptional regulator